MSLYLCLFAGQKELAGLEVGSYDDYNDLRRAIAAELESGEAGSRFPTFMLHGDCDGEWPADECPRLREELSVIAAEMQRLPPRPITLPGHREAVRDRGIRPGNAFESYVDVDGEFLIARLRELAEIACKEGLPILFQ